MAVLILVGSALRLHNAWHADPRWGIDPGCHVPLMEFVAENGRRPTPAEFQWSHVAPAFYFLAGWEYRCLTSLGLSRRAAERGLMLTQAAINIAGLFAVWSLARSVGGRDGPASAIAVGLFAFLPANVQLAMQFSNECLQQTLLLWCTALTCRLMLGDRGRATPMTVAALAVALCGAAAIKINALPLMAVSAAFLGLYCARERRPWLGGSVTCIACVAFALAVHANRNDALRANLALGNTPRSADPIRSILRFDPLAAQHPFAPPDIEATGKQVFWTMLYLTTFSDYVGVYHNQAHARTLPSSEIVALYPTGGIYPGFLPATRYRHLRRLALWSLPFVALAPVALLSWSARALRGHDLARIYLLTVAVAAWASLFYFGISHPCGGHPVKAIYIMHGLGALAVIMGVELAGWIRARRLATAAFVSYAVPWATFAWAAHWIIPGSP